MNEKILDIKRIAFLYRQNRDSQKIATKRLEFAINNILYSIIPFNMDKYSNPNTILKRLSKYNEIIVFEYDYDIKEILNRLDLKYHNFIPTIFEGFLKNWSYHSFYSTKDIFMQKIPLDFSSKMIEKTICEILNLKKTIITYYVENGEIKERAIQLEPNVEPFNNDKSEVAKTYIANLSAQTETMELTVFHNKEKLKKFKEKYKELLC